MRRLRYKKCVRLALLILAVWLPLAWLAAEKLIVRAELPRADAIVVLSGSTTYKERTRRAAQLFRDGRSAKIILTDDNQRGGWSNTQQRNVSFAERAAEELQRARVPEENFLTLPQPVFNTREEAVLVRDFAEAHGLRSILVVTSAYHSRRALWTWRNVFEGSGIEIGLDPVAPGEQTPEAQAWWLYPRGWSMVAGEYLKMAYYWVRYR